MLELDLRLFKDVAREISCRKHTIILAKYGVKGLKCETMKATRLDEPARWVGKVS